MPQGQQRDPAAKSGPEPADGKSSRYRLRPWIEWGLIIGLFLFLQFTPQGKQVLGLFQRGILATGLFKPDIEFAEQNDIPASYNVQLETLDGEPMSLESMRGKVIFMNLWATWCAPCLAEMPYIQSLYDDVAAEDIVFVMMSLDESVDDARQFVQRRGYTFPVYRPTSRLPEPYSSRTIPTTYVISADGKVATIHTGMANVDTPEFKAFLRSLARGEERP